MHRKIRPLDALIPKTRQQILATTLLCPEKAWYLSDLAKHLRVPPSSLQRELKRLVEAEILRRREEGNLVYFQANRHHPIFPELHGLFTKTAGLLDHLRRALDRFRSRILVGFVYGSVATGHEQSGSDVDLLIVGEITLADLSPMLPEIEERLGRPINPTFYSGAELSEKVRSGHHFVRSVLAKEKLFVVGDEHVLAEIVAGRPGRSARHKQSRD